jgi:hypothetical protein
MTSQETRKKCGPLMSLAMTFSLQLMRRKVVKALASLNTLPERGTLLSKQEYTLSNLVSLVRKHV